MCAYGRGLWILRDVWQLEQDAPGAGGGAAEIQIQADSESGARRAAAPTVFSMAAAPTAPSIEIMEASGAVLSATQVQGRAGVQR